MSQVRFLPGAPIRPREEGAPLVEAGLGKAEVRGIAYELGLPNVRDRDQKFSRSFDEVFKTEGAKVILGHRKGHIRPSCSV